MHRQTDASEWAPSGEKPVECNSDSVLHQAADRAHGGNSWSYAEPYPNDSQATIAPSQYLVDISGGVAVFLLMPLAYSPRVAGNCDKNDAGSHKVYTSKESCDAVSGTWHPCSDSTHGIQNDCEGNDAVWHGNGYGCENPDFPHHADCDADSKKWRSCSTGENPDTHANQTSCQSADGIWFDDWGYDQGFGCSDR